LKGASTASASGPQRFDRGSGDGAAGPKDFFSSVETQIDPTHFWATSEMLARFTGQGPQPNKAIIGKNAFAHESASTRTVS
jgi:hypothetical protein